MFSYLNMLCIVWKLPKTTGTYNVLVSDSNLKIQKVSHADVLTNDGISSDLPQFHVDGAL